MQFVDTMTLIPSPLVGEGAEAEQREAEAGEGL